MHVVAQDLPITEKQLRCSENILKKMGEKAVNLDRKLILISVEINLKN